LDFLIVIFVPLAIYAAIVTLIVGLVSFARKTPMRNGYVALGWSVLILIGAGIIGSLVPTSISNGATWLSGALIAYLIARRDGYQLDGQSWILLFLLAPGYWLVLWRRANKIWRESQQITGPEPAI
jgi:energy-coupling factor transporter transmembrane protein EcfT